MTFLIVLLIHIDGKRKQIAIEIEQVKFRQCLRIVVLHANFFTGHGFFFLILMFTPYVCRLRNVDRHKPSRGINASVNLYI